jgi:phospholipase D1/2
LTYAPSFRLIQPNTEIRVPDTDLDIKHNSSSKKPSAMSRKEDDLAYGDDYGKDRGAGSQSTDRGIVGDTFNFLKTKYKQSQQPQQSQSPYGYTEQSSQPGGQQYNPTQAGYVSQLPQRLVDSEVSNETKQNPNTGTQPPYPGGPIPQPAQSKPDTVTSIFNTLHGVVHGVGAELAGKLGTHNEPSSAAHGSQSGQATSQGAPATAGVTGNRYNSFARQQNGNDVKWYVDGCSYMYAVSRALETAKESIWILDCE